MRRHDSGMGNAAPCAGTRPYVLIVDDDPDVAGLLQKLLAGDGHRAAVAGDGGEALALVAARQPDLVLLDLDMPRLGGFEVCRRLKGDPATRLIPVVILTGREEEARLPAWELGADDFVRKPFRAAELLARCRALLRLKAAVDELDSAHAVVFALARAVEAKCPYTRGHSERVTALALALAGRLGLAPAEREVLRRGGLLHDLGKISVPDAVLNKPGPLTEEECELVRRHPAEGARIVEPLGSLRDVVPLIRWHHERPDGKGYPDGLAGDGIPLLARVLAVADVYDALSSPRPYRGALLPGQCLDLLRRGAAGGGLDPELVRCFTDAATWSAGARLIRTDGRS